MPKAHLRNIKAAASPAAALPGKYAPGPASRRLCLLEGRFVNSKSEIPRPGRSPDSVPYVFAFPVSQWQKKTLPVTVTASSRICTGFPFHREIAAPGRCFYIRFRRHNYSTVPRECQCCASEAPQFPAQFCGMHFREPIRHLGTIFPIWAPEALSFCHKTPVPPRKRPEDFIERKRDRYEKTIV